MEVAAPPLFLVERFSRHQILSPDIGFFRLPPDYPPATAGTMLISASSATGVSSPSAKRISSPST